MTDTEKKPLTRGKKIWIGIEAVVFLICLVICAWYFYIVYYGAEKMTSSTINVGELVQDDGDKRYVIEVDYNSNANNNGLEKLDIKLNYFTDETTEHFYSQGLQYVANSKEDKINWVNYDNYTDYLNGEINKIVGEDGAIDINEFAKVLQDNNALTSYQLKKTGWWIFGDEYKAAYYKPFVNPNTTSRYNYQSFDDFDTIGSTNPIKDDSYFTLQLGGVDELVYMQFKGDNYISSKDFSEKHFEDEFKADDRKIGQAGTINYYNYSNADYMAYLIYTQIQTLPAGTNGTFVLEFGDNMFKYYLVDEDGNKGEEIKDEDSLKVQNRIKSYYTIKINISADGAKNANDSIFGVLHGSANYTVDGSTSGAGDYFQGKTVVNVDVYDFDLIHVAEEYYALKLKDNFLKEYLPYKDKIYLSINIDTSILEASGYKFAGFTSDSGLDNFDILKTNKPLSREVIVC